MKANYWLLLLLVALVLCGCQKAAPAQPATTAPATEATQAVPVVPETTAPELYENLTAWAESEEEARQIAESYGIEFCSYGANIATFHTDEDPAEVVRRGQAQGLPELSVNGQSKAF